MSDLIDRQAAIDAVDVSNLHRGIVSALQEIIRELPSAQPEIIRCKDCKHQEKFFHEDRRRKDGGHYIYGCELADGYSHVCLDDDFCSRGERRT